MDATAPPNEPYWFDTGTVPQLVESADVLTLVVDHDDGSRVTAEFGTSEAGWAVVKLSHDERPIAGAGALDSARLEGAGAIAMLPDGAVVVALVGASDLPRDNVVIYASPDRPLDSVATGVWTQYDNRLVLLAIIPAGATRIDVGGVTPNTATIYELPTDPSEFPPASANQAPP